MKQLYLIIAGVLMACLPLSAQISQGGTPLCKHAALSLENVEQVQLAPFNLNQILAEDAEDEKAGSYPKIGRVRSLDIHVNNVDSWTDVEGGKLWRIALKSRDAKGLSVQFEDFSLPTGAKLFIYSPDFKHVIGAFTSFNNHESGILSTELIPSDEVIVEYFEPSEFEGSGQFKIAGLVHAYRMVPGAETEQRDFGDSDPCQVNVNCSEGNNWQDEKRGVVRILIIEGQFAGWCTGSVINNTAQDCTPYVLTALHCGINASVNNMNQWVFYFNYESSGCANGSSGQVPNNSMTGCARIADSGDGGGNNGSDFMLVEINNDIPEAYDTHYNGWRRNNVTSPSGVSIHHPAGDIKKISTYSSNLQSVTWGGPAGTHWLVTWSSTANGHGVTEGGSSGSPIFDNQGLIIGTLTGGSSFCNNPTSPDLYGKMSYHWNSNPGDNLSQYLDPGNTGATSLGGADNPCNGQGGGDECEAGTVSVSTNQNVCPGETGIFDATGVQIPAGGGYAVQFLPDGGTGGNEVGFSITGVEPLPFEFDSDINGVLSANALPPLSGTWLVAGFAYTDPEDAGGSFCSITEIDVTVNFLAADDPACEGGGDDCIADIPYPEDDPCVIVVIAADDFCCNTEWDEFCEDAYVACSSGGDCEAGTVSASTNQDVCPGETGVFDATDVVIPTGGGYAVQFAPNGGTGGNEVGFSITGVNPLPFEFDNDINGILSANELPPLSGTWVLTGFAYIDPEDAGGSFCSIADVDVTVNFLAADDPACAGGSDDNDDCADATLIAPGIHPFSTVDATTDGPDQPGSDCDAFQESNVNNDVWFEYTATCDGLASFSTCGTANFDTRIAVYPGGQCPPSAGSLIICNDDFGDCADFSSFLEWEVTEGSTYLLRIGGYSAEDSGSGTFELIEDCDFEPTDWCDDWVDPTPTSGYNNFNTLFGGAPTPNGSGECEFFEITDFEVWMSEAYAMDNIQAGVAYTFSHCNGPGAGTWVAEYTIIAPSGTVDAYGAGDGDGCSMTWIASESGTYLIVINEAGNCGVASQTDNGFPAITCSDALTSIEESPAVESFTIFPNPNNGQFVVELNGTGGLAQVDVLEVSGKVVQSAQMNFTQSTQHQVDMGSQAGGLYFVRITMNDQIMVHKVTVY